MTTSLPTTRLGWTGMHLTRTGFGAWAIGGGGWAYTWGSQDDAASIAAIRHAVESGINWIDTAAVPPPSRPPAPGPALHRLSSKSGTSSTYLV